MAKILRKSHNFVNLSTFFFSMLKNNLNPVDDFTYLLHRLTVYLDRRCYYFSFQFIIIFILFLYMVYKKIVKFTIAAYSHEQELFFGCASSFSAEFHILEASKAEKNILFGPPRIKKTQKYFMLFVIEKARIYLQIISSLNFVFFNG